MPISSVDVAATLRDAGLRVTAPRVAVLFEVTDGGHVTADQVARAVRERIGTISTQAVYDVLGALTRAGLVRRIEPAGGPAHYETASVTTITMSCAGRAARLPTSIVSSMRHLAYRRRS